MPTYDYKCKNPKCGYVQEELHKIKQKPRIKCARCGEKCTKMMGKGAGVIFKGDGFYETDYRKKDQTNERVIKAIKENAPDEQLKGGGVNRKDL
jgi:putative FmdB family regulatory protein